MKLINILAIETSCDETSIAIVQNGKKVIEQVTNTQIEKFKDLGGVVPEMASRMHAQNIFYVYNEVFRNSEITIEEISAIAVTQGPGLMGSLLVGINFAKMLALEYKKKLIAINHMEAHIYACNIEHEMKFPHLSLIVSGGHSEFILLKDHLDFVKIGSTLDDALGECFDKVGRMLKLPYPGGPEIDRLAKVGIDEYPLPYPKDDQSLDFSFSGIKSACYNLINTKTMKGEVINRENFACSFQNRVFDVVKKKLDIAIETYKPLQVSIVGGVSANSQLRKKINEDIIIPNIKYSTDNAAMIGALGYFYYKEGKFVNPLTLNVNVGLEIEESIKIDI